MDLFNILWKAFDMNERSAQELLRISTLIDYSQVIDGSDYNEKCEVDIIASTIVALQNNRNLSDIGQQLYDEITRLIVQKNLEEVSLNDGERLYKSLLSKECPGTYKVIQTNVGCKFNLVTANGELLVTSEIYSTVESCMRGIVSMKKNIFANIEDQTVEGYKVVANPKYEMYRDKAGAYRYRLKAMNGQILAVSAGYVEKSLCMEAISKTKYSGDTDNIEKG